MAAGLDYFNTIRVNRVIRQLQDVREMPQALKFLNRTPVVPASDYEITGRFVGRAQISDIITTNAKSNVYRYGKMDFINYNIPKIKHGVAFDEDDVRQLISISGQGVRDAAGADFLGNVRARAVDSILLGIRQRWEAMIIAAKLDGLHYDRLGMKIDATWQMPSDLKVNVANYWTDATNGTPVNDIFAIRLLASKRYGVDYDRMTMSRQAFQYMITTTEFQNKARLFLAPNVSFTNLTLTNLGQQQQLASSILGIDIEFYDARYWSQADDGSEASYNFLPVNVVILESKSADNDAQVFDLANGTTTESAVRSALPNDGSDAAAIGGGTYGPHAYTHIPADLDPPTMTIYGVARSYPRKWVRQSNAYLRIGNFTDTIAVGEPFT